MTAADDIILFLALGNGDHGVHGRKFTARREIFASTQLSDMVSGSALALRV